MTTKVPPQLLSGGPVFSAYRNTNQTGLTSTIWTKVQLNAESFDSDSMFDAATNHRFQPTIAGYYQINGAAIFASNGSVTACGVAIYKNGSVASPPSYSPMTGIGAMAVSTLVYLNGSTDYVELYGYIASSGTLSFAGGADATAMSGHLVKAA